MMCGKCDICGNYFDFASGKIVQQMELTDFNTISKYKQLAVTIFVQIA